MTAEHLHLVINHIPFLGSAFALITLLICERCGRCVSMAAAAHS